MSNTLVTDTYKQTKRVSRSSSKSADTKTCADSAPSTSESKFERDIELLKSFDLTLEYGPCTGISRLERWSRAEKHGLNPPQSVYNLLQLHADDDNYKQNLWKDYDL
ncbi:hypothetical protein SNE40_004116 [Patella caerulea]|uniref:DNA polymerase delta subunit 4 n=1 Tax=Patella caerulea TaxID=87958 RepID=A0AAN8KCM3_PATCE